MRAALVVTVALALLAGCKKDPPAPSKPAAKPEAAPPTAAVEAQEKAPAASPAPPEAVPKDEPATEPESALDEQLAARLQQTLEKTHCILKRNERTGLKAVYEAGGFDSASDFADAFAKARALDQEWAEVVLAKAVTLDCSTPKAPPSPPAP